MSNNDLENKKCMPWEGGGDPLEKAGAIPIAEGIDA